MKFTRVKTTLVAGLMAASMLAPGMTAFAEDGATTAKYPTLNKTVQVGGGITLPANDTIKFTAKQYDADTSTAGVFENTDTSIQPATIDDTELTIALNALTDVENSTNKTGSINVKAIVDKIETAGKNGEYTFEITETAPTDKDKLTPAAEYGWDIDDAKYYLHIVRTEKDGTVTYYYYAYKGTDGTGTDKKVGGGDSDTNDGDFGLTFTNSYTKKAGSDPSVDPDDPDGGDDKTPEGSLVIAKNVTEGNASATNEYTFTVTFESSTTTTIDSTTDYVYAIVKSSATAADDDYTHHWTQSAGTIQLADGYKAVFKEIPAGVKVTVVETKDSNTTSTNVKSAFNGASTYTTDTNSTTLTASGTLGEKSNKITFENKVKDVPILGVVTDVAPYITIMVVAVAAVAAYVVMKRRVAR